MTIEEAVEKLTESHRGGQALRDWMTMIENGGDQLDYGNWKAIETLSHAMRKHQDRTFLADIQDKLSTMTETNIEKMHQRRNEIELEIPKQTDRSEIDQLKAEYNALGDEIEKKQQDKLEEITGIKI